MSSYTSYFNDTHEQARLSARQFIQREVLPHIGEWEEAGGFPRDIYRKAGETGLLGVGHDPAYGGTGEDVFLKIAVTEEIMRGTSGGFAASLGSLDIALPPLEKWGSQALKDRFVAPTLAGELVAALAITEPSGGSDVAGLKTRAERRQDAVNGDHYVVTGSKIFITSGIRADFYVTAVRTGGPGYAGISLLLIERERAGVSTGQ
ncbi:MAG: acyl-CoA dehydrogenase family protein, partial [Perlucidibaca sp.]